MKKLAVQQLQAVWLMHCRFELYGRPSTDRIYIFNGETLSKLQLL
jgi:hypothetical protein